jgi:hypothetical protein
MIDENLEKSLSFVDDLLFRCHSIAKKRFGVNVCPEIVMSIYDKVREQEEEILADEAYQFLSNQVDDAYQKALETHKKASNLIN